MIMKYLYVFILGLIVGALLCFKYKQPEVIIDTEIEYVYDTIPKIIKEPYEVIIMDTIEVELPTQIDTVYVIQDYFNKYVQTRLWEDKDIRISLTDTVTKNSLVTGTLDYTILRPLEAHSTTITHTNKYIYLGASTPIKSPLNTSIRISYANRLIYSIAYRPYTNTFELGVGFKVKEW